MRVFKLEKFLRHTTSEAIREINVQGGKVTEKFSS